MTEILGACDYQKYFCVDQKEITLRMNGNSLKDVSRFFMAGINYKKTDAAIRSQFAILDDQYAAINESAYSFGVKEFFIVSTCNRTEIYGFADNAAQLINLLCTQTQGSVEKFSELAYVKQDIYAIEHLFEVAAGLDSQILGDYEIVGQIKKAARIAKDSECIDAFTERLINNALQASKAIKNKTELSGGTVSVSFAAVQYIRENVKAVKSKDILLLGTGKIGRNTCKNIVDYLGTTKVTLINRTEEKAKLLAIELGLQSAPLEQLAQHIRSADIIITATNSTEPVILEQYLNHAGQKLIIDLSVPYNIEIAAQQLSNIKLVNVDELSKMKDKTLSKRTAEVPKAKAIIAEHVSEFMEWYKMRKNVPVLKAVKSKLKEIHTSPLFIPLSNNQLSPDDRIQRVINGMASKMREQNQKGCYYIEAINEFIATGS
ncbi:MAG TPA: glutamyl-tRNA reductase [Chitinophagaceae bacterium]|nr:glutamyl-tRNA reductase [Chitinophagaceae bacterium]